jgi:hypothetical protein
MCEQATHCPTSDSLLIREVLGARQNLKRQCLQSIARQDGGRFVEGPMAGRTAASQVIVVHGGQIVVHEAVNVNELDRGRWIIERLKAGA